MASGDHLPDPDVLVDVLAGSLGAGMAEPVVAGAVAVLADVGAMLDSGFMAGAVAAGAGAAASGAF